MTTAGLAAYAHRKDVKSRTYAYEQAETATLEPKELALFRRNKAAWKFFERQAHSYRHRAIWRIVSTKRAETRRNRFAKLIEASENGLRL